MFHSLSIVHSEVNTPFFDNNKVIQRHEATLLSYLPLCLPATSIIPCGRSWIECAIKDSGDTDTQTYTPRPHFVPNKDPEMIYCAKFYSRRLLFEKIRHKRQTWYLQSFTLAKPIAHRFGLVHQIWVFRATRGSPTKKKAEYDGSLDQLPKEKVRNERDVW